MEPFYVPPTIFWLIWFFGAICGAAFAACILDATGYLRREDDQP